MKIQHKVFGKLTRIMRLFYKNNRVNDNRPSSARNVINFLIDLTSSLMHWSRILSAVATTTSIWYWGLGLGVSDGSTVSSPFGAKFTITSSEGLRAPVSDG
jgi:hypothetical protein